MLTAAPSADGPATAAASARPTVDASLAKDAPELLARRVFAALQASDAALYLEMTPSSDEDFLAFAALRSDAPPLPSAEKRAQWQAKQRARFEDILLELSGRGIDPGKMKLGAIDTSKVERRSGLGFAEDLTFVVTSGDKSLHITIDDCALAPRGWITIDGLKLRPQPAP